MSASQELPEPCGRVYSARKLLRAGWRRWLLVATAVVPLSGWLAIVGDWSPWLSAQLPRPYQLVEMIWSLLSPRWSFTIAVIVLGAFSFEEYHRNRTHQKSVTPWFLLGCAAVSAALAVVSWTARFDPNTVPSSPPAPTLERQNKHELDIRELLAQTKAASARQDKQDQILDQQNTAIERLNIDLGNAHKQLLLQAKIASLSFYADSINEMLAMFDQRMETLNTLCINDLPSLGPRGFDAYRAMRFMPNFETTVKDIANRARIPVPKFDDLGGIDTNRPAPGQEQFPTEDQKYDFRIGYWKCKARAALGVKLKEELLSKLRNTTSDRLQAEVSLRAYAP